MTKKDLANLLMQKGQKAVWAQKRVLVVISKRKENLREKILRRTRKVRQHLRARL